MRIAWAFTGAGHLLKDSVEVLEKLAKEHEVSVFLSKAGEEVLKMYGLFERVTDLTGGYYRELYSEIDQQFSFPITGRFSMGKYDLVVVSPTTSNTVAKIAYGIADSLVTNVVAQAGKGKVKTIIVPVDIEEGDLETVLPSKLELGRCADCEVCVASESCPQKAIIPKTDIDLLKCTGCGECRGACPFDAISVGKLISIYMRPMDIENTNKLRSIENVYVLESPKNVIEFIDSLE